MIQEEKQTLMSVGVKDLQPAQWLDHMTGSLFAGLTGALTSRSAPAQLGPRPPPSFLQGLECDPQS
jgi:hypothetical protein